MPESTANCQVQSPLDKFDICSEEEVRETVCSAESKTYVLDALPTDILKRLLPELLPFVTAMCNASLQQGGLPLSQRRAIVAPRLKQES